MEFQGFQQILPTVVVLLVILLLVFISWFTYRKITSIPALGRWSLTGLRAFSLILLFLLILNPFFYSSRTVEIKPHIAVFLDNSESVDIQKGGYNGLSTYMETLEALDLTNRTTIQTDLYTFGEKVSEIDAPAPDASETQTNLSEPIQSILEMEDDVQAAVLLSDGIISYGRNPSVSAFNSSIPIYTIALGDTARVRDISVSNVLTNATGYTDTRHVVEAEITQSGFRGYSTRVSLNAKNTTLSETQVQFQADDEVQSVTFELELKEPGLQPFEIKAEPLNDEWTTENNQMAFNIDVLDGKTRILDIAFQIHPDVKAVRRILEEDKSIELSTLTWLGGQRFVEDLPQEKEYNLLIFHGLPKGSVRLDFINSFQDRPTILFNMERADANMEELYKPLRLIDFSNSNVASVRLKESSDASEQAILELPAADLSESPSLFAPLRSSINDPGAISLYQLNFDGLDTNAPALATLQRGNIRRTHILPWGWYRLLQNTEASQRSYYRQLITNIVSWTASDPDDRLLRITPSKRSFRTSENAVINGSLQNERGEPENEGIVEFELKTEEGSARTFNMENSNQGNYRLSLPRLSEGRYAFSATARKGNRVLDTQDGEFLVANTSSELTNTRRNDALLGAIATNSGGVFFAYENAPAIWDSLEAKGLLASQTEEIEEYLFPVRFMYWFLLVLILLGSEWLLRKYYSLP